MELRVEPCLEAMSGAAERIYYKGGQWTQIRPTGARRGKTRTPCSRAARLRRGTEAQASLLLLLSRSVSCVDCAR